MSSFGVSLFTDSNFVVNFLFGLVIITLYAKDKFNMPTYDKEAMGPFSQLPPQLLTVDSRYRRGLRTYILSLLAVYTAICIIGPNTFSDQKIALGFTAGSNQLWPVAAATFLISTGAARDSSLLGRVELFFRQYAHKTAYIPTTVRDLAHGLRTVDIGPWLSTNDHKLRQIDFETRRDAIVRLIGEENLPSKADQAGFGHRAAWARANIAFYALQQIFSSALGREKLAELIESQENREIFDRLRKMHDQIRSDFKASHEHHARSGPEEVSDKLIASIQRFAKEVSLMIVVLLSQGARSPVALQEQLEQLGFRRVDLGDHSDHLVYVILVSASVVVAAVFAFALHFLLSSVVNKFGITQTDVRDEFSTVDFTREFITIGTALLIYIVTFRIVDYLRERDLDTAEWQEGLRGYVMAVLPAAFIATTFSVLLLVLVLAPFGLIRLLWQDFTGLLLFFLFQFCVSILTAAFSLGYIGLAVRMIWPEENAKWAWLKTVVQSLFRFSQPEDFLKLWHALLAALLVGAMTYFFALNSKNMVLDVLKLNLDFSRQSLKSNQDGLQQKLSAAYPPVQTAIPQQPVNTAKNPSAISVTDIDAYLSALYARIDAPSGERPKGGFDAELKGLTQICEKLNAISLDPASPTPPDVTGDTPPPAPPRADTPPPRTGTPRPPERVNAPGDNSSAGPPPKAIIERMFKVPSRCEPDYSQKAPEEMPMVQFASMLSVLYQSLNYLRATSPTQSKFGDLLVPVFTAFLMAYLFGAGCRLFRAWWLQNETGRQEIERLKEQIAGHIGHRTDAHAFERWLRRPLAFLNRVTPIEAVRYEGLKARLFARIENQRNDQLNLDHILEPKAAPKKN